MSVSYSELRRFYDNAQFVTQRIDPNLRLLDILKYAGRQVYLVEHQGRKSVLKFAYSDDPESFQHVAQERKILEILADVQGITHLVRGYNNYHAVLKEWKESSKNRLWTRRDCISLHQTVEQIHQRGIAGLDLCQYGNLILPVNPEPPILVDVGSGKLRKESVEEEFIQSKQKDIIDLESLMQIVDIKTYATPTRS